jgi:hypothetical protein
MDKEKLRDEGLNYLVTSNFVDAYVKKLMFCSDIDDLYEDYRQEAFVAICEQKPEIWEKLYNSAIEKGKPFDYELRNYFSIVIRNVVKSDSSNAYRKLKRHSITELRKNDTQWKLYSNSIPDPKTITEQIADMND